MLRVAFAVVVAAFCATAVLPAQDASRADAASMRKKLEAIILRGEGAGPPRKSPPLRTALSEREVNAYFQVDGPQFLPAGVLAPRFVIDRGGHVSVTAVVKLDDALQTKKRSWLDPLAWASGSYEVSATGTLQAQNGLGRLTLEKATLGGVPVPISVLQQVVSYYSRTPEAPEGFSLDKPFELPARIQSVETDRGRALIVQ
jgi:hypothetical protein